MRCCPGVEVATRMDQKTRNVLDAADKWLAAINAVTAAGEGEDRHDGEVEQAELDSAEVALVSATKDWRDAGRPE
jgi:hypothetical protein